MTRTDFSDPKNWRFAEVAERLAQLPPEERALAIQRALAADHSGAQENAGSARSLSDLQLIESIRSMMADEVQTLVREAALSGLAETILDVTHTSKPTAASSARPRCHRGAGQLGRATPKCGECRVLRELLETARGLRPYLPAKVGALAQIKAKLRAAKCPIPCPRREPTELTRRVIEAARRGETVEVSIDEL